MSKKLRSNLLLLVTALIWGTAFVAQSNSTELLGPFTFNAARSFVAGLALLPVIYFADKRRKAAGEAAPESAPGGMKTLVTGGVLCGIILAVASALQQTGIIYTTVAKAGFITALYMVIVPIIGIFLKKNPHFTVWISVAIAVAGMYLLCMKGGEPLSLQKGDFLMLCCAFGYSFHILVIDHYSPVVDCLKMSCIQFFVAAALSAIVMLFTETPSWDGIISAIGPILYTGVMSSGVGYTLQMIAQKNTEPAVAGLIMSLESVFAALAGWVLLNQTLSARELIGCVLVFAAILLTQTPDLIAAARAKKGPEGR